MFPVNVSLLLFVFTMYEKKILQNTLIISLIEPVVVVWDLTVIYIRFLLPVIHLHTIIFDFVEISKVG